MRLSFIILLLLIFTTPVFSQNNGGLKIKVEGIKSAEGAIAAAVYGNADTFLKKDYKNIHQRIDHGETYIFFDKLPAGKYAISVFYDVNNNKKLDTNFIGLPTEAYGFGNNARGMFGPPSFEKASVDVEPGRITEIVVEVR